MSSESVKKPMAAIAPFGLRMQPDLKERIEKAAAANNRSMNAEIVARLEGSFEAISESDATEMVEAVIRAVNEDPVGIALNYNDEALEALEVAGRERGIPGRLIRDFLLEIVTDWLTTHGYLPSPKDD